MVLAENVCLVEGEVGLQIFFCARHKGKGVACSQQQNEKRLSPLFKELPLLLFSPLRMLLKDHPTLLQSENIKGNGVVGYFLVHTDLPYKPEEFTGGSLL